MTIDFRREIPTPHKPANWHGRDPTYSDHERENFRFADRSSATHRCEHQDTEDFNKDGTIPVTMLSRRRLIPRTALERLAQQPLEEAGK